MLLVFATALGLTPCAPVCAEALKAPIALDAGKLSDALHALSARSGADLLFLPTDVGDRRSPPVAGVMTVEAALDRLLAGSGLSFRRTAGGTFVIYPAPAPSPLAVPEVLVVAHRTQNMDIRRTPNDIQVYAMVSSADILASPADDVEAVLRTRLPINAEAQAPSQNPIGQMASNRSEVNLHGLGADQTLVLVDGARMPGVPSQTSLSLNQPDINGLPLAAIDRIETLTATAGGIFGPGALGGVVNVVLKRDYRGADFGATYGVAGEGDGVTRRLDGRIGFSPDGGATSVMVVFARTDVDGLDVGARDYTVAARRLDVAQNPLNFLSQGYTVNGVTVLNLDGGNLSLIPALGGRTLGSSFTYLPIGYAGLASDNGALLAANAGKIPTTLYPDALGSGQGLTSRTATTSLLVNVRRAFGDKVEAFADLIGYQNDGHSQGGTQTSVLDVLASAPTNPFQQDVLVAFPMPGFSSPIRNELSTIRLSAGVIVHLPGQWTANATYAFGWVRSAVVSDYASLADGADVATALGVSPAAGKPVLNPFGSWSSLVSAMQAYKGEDLQELLRENHFQDGGLRLAGPIFTTRAGPVSLSLLAERRREDIPSTVQTDITSDDGTIVQPTPGFVQTVESVYGEVRAPLVARDGAPWILRGLEIQLAERFDRVDTAIPDLAVGDLPQIRLPDAGDPGATVLGRSNSQSAIAYTAGLRVFPLDHLMLRASVSTGALPPTPQQLVEVSADGALGYEQYTDPKRGGRSLGGAYTILEGGSKALKPAQAQTLSVGLVVNPEGRLPRLSLDYTHIEVRDEIIAASTAQYFLDNESLYPGRIQRAPLTAADAAQGFTGGVVTGIDDTAANAGHTVTDALDVTLDYLVQLGERGVVRLHGAATWQPRLNRLASLDSSPTEFAGFADGPLKWRGNAGLDWKGGPYSAGLNVQVYAGYYAAYAALGAGDPAIRDQIDLPGVRIPAQAYLDLSAAYRFSLAAPGGPPQACDARLRIANLLNRQPPVVTDSGYIYSSYNYSSYGDARGRRFEASLSTHF